MATGDMNKLPLVVIVGPTASGKTALAIKLAKQFGGEIISADSRAIYRGLDIGTAKPTAEEQREAPHWGIDLVNPGERYTASDFQSYAYQKISEIRARGHVPFLVGGTGLYIDAVVYHFVFPESGNNIVRRSELDSMSLEQLYEYSYKHNVSLPENHRNKRYVVNNILRRSDSHKRNVKPGNNTIIVGITTDRVTLRERIHTRARRMFDSDVVKEAMNVAVAYGWDNEAMTGNIYPLIRKMQAGELTRSEAIEKFETLDWHLAKRQLTWFKRDEHIQWLELDVAYSYIARYLADVFNS